MRDFQLNEKGDVEIAGNRVITIAEGDEVAQRVLTTLKSRLLEFEPEPTMGLSQENLFGKYGNVDFAKQDIQEAIENQVADVASVDQIKMTPNLATRVMNVDIIFTVQSGVQQTLNTSVGGEE